MRYFTNGEMEYDKDEEWSAQGIVDQAVVDDFLSENWYTNHKSPKTTGRETLGDGEAQELIDKCSRSGLSKYDTLATITRITAQHSIEQYRKFYPRHDKIDEIFMCEGGARTRTSSSL